MILGVGTDMASIGRIEQALETHGDRFKERCFAAEEQAYVERAGNTGIASGYAKRWAAKEAAAKALGLGIREGIYLKDIVVLNDKDGRPGLDLRGGARDRLNAILPQGMTADTHLSLSDEGGQALAFVVISATARTIS